jgi:hypothetical protein
MALRRPHVTPGDKPLQVAFLVAGKLGQVKLPDVTKQRYLGVRQVVGNSLVSGSAPGTVALIVPGGNSRLRSTQRRSPGAHTLRADADRCWGAGSKKMRGKKRR